MTVAEGGGRPAPAGGASQLQWGRNLTVAEGCGRHRERLFSATASMGPQLDGCGRRFCAIMRFQLLCTLQRDGGGLARIKANPPLLSQKYVTISLPPIGGSREGGGGGRRGAGRGRDPISHGAAHEGLGSGHREACLPRGPVRPDLAPNPTPSRGPAGRPSAPVESHLLQLARLHSRGQRTGHRPAAEAGEGRGPRAHGPQSSLRQRWPARFPGSRQRPRHPQGGRTSARRAALARRLRC